MFSQILMSPESRGFWNEYEQKWMSDRNEFGSQLWSIWEFSKIPSYYIVSKKSVFLIFKVEIKHFFSSKKICSLGACGHRKCMLNTFYKCQVSECRLHCRNEWCNFLKQQKFISHSCVMSTESDLGVLQHVINILEPGLLGQPLFGTLPISVAKGKITDYHYLQTVEILLLHTLDKAFRQ